MAIFRRLVFALLMLAAGASNAAASAEQFLRALNAPADVMEGMLSGEGAIRRCLALEKSLLCVQGRGYPNIGENQLAKNAILQGLGASIRADLYNAIAAGVKAPGLRNECAVGEALEAGEKRGTFALKGMEWQTFCRGNWCGAMAAANLAEARKQLPSVYTERPFIKDYCAALFPEAAELMAKGKSAEALIKLKELHDLNFANIKAYLLAVRAFIQEKQAKEGEKIAVELLRDFYGKMNASEAEDLGDLFAELNLTGQAEECYKLASLRLTAE